ncbi:hypothetical protein F2Q68_00031802 [Brassica cretica]|uniref:Uncharacterized protein n=1 Tax=Brassica cretica TaxID=69181 RepID=A0A8S9GCL4_BRACR|nr:hypothetical protein F2Q68_00031802 [Brassica cretica]
MHHWVRASSSDFTGTPPQPRRFADCRNRTTKNEPRPGHELAPIGSRAGSDASWLCADRVAS